MTVFAKVKLTGVLTVMAAYTGQDDVVQLEVKAGGELPPVASIDAKLLYDPALLGAFAVIVKLVEAFCANAEIVAVQNNGVFAKVVYGKVTAVPDPPDVVLQLTPLIPLPFVIAVITEPVGNNSSTVALVPDVVEPVFEIVKV